MEIHVNGESRDVPDACSAADLIALLDLSGRRVALEVNLEIVPRSGYAEHRLRAGDKVEIVHAIGGG